MFKKNGESEWSNATEKYGKPSPSKFSNISIKKGDRVQLILPAGGGFGDPRQRDKELIENDINEGYISKEYAKLHFGYEVNQQ